MPVRVSRYARAPAVIAAFLAAAVAASLAACVGHGPATRSVPHPAVAAGLADARDGQTFDDCAGAGWCPRLVAIPAGRFVMGAPVGEVGRADVEGPPRPVTVGRFATGAYPVTRGEWAAFAAVTGRPAVGGCAWARVGGMARGYTPALDAAASWAHMGFAQDDRHPVVCVS